MSIRRPGPRDLEMDERAVAREKAKRAIVRQSVGREIRQRREAAGLSQTQVGDFIGWMKDSVSKLERGGIDITLYDYLVLMRNLKDVDPNHPAMPLVDHLLPRGRSAATDAA